MACPMIEPHAGHWRHTPLEHARVTSWCDGGQPRTPETDRILSQVIGAEPLSSTTLDRLADLLTA
jgi:hypothetical protein